MAQESLLRWLTHAEPGFPQMATWNHAQNVLQRFFNNITSLTAIYSFFTLCLNNPTQLLSYYTDTDPLESALYFASGIATVHYILSEITKNYSQVDRAWSILPALYAWHFTLHDYLSNGSTIHPRLLVASILISIWGTRLTYNFARKGGYYWSGQDYRYPYLRKKLGAVGMALLNIIFIAPAQNYILLLIVTPLYVINSVSASSMMRETNLTSLDYITVTLHLMFLLLESVADEQMYFFQTEKYALLSHLESHQLKGDYKLGFLWHSGLFQYSRHPNFFAEQLMWWVIYLFSVSAVQVASGLSDLSTYLNWTIAGPIVLTSLFQGSTWLTEKISSEKYPAYTNYRKSVSRFVPWFPSNSSSNTDKKEL